MSDSARYPIISLPKIKFSPSYLNYLQGFVQSTAVLKRNGYILNPLSAKDIERKMRCDRCGKYLQKGSNSNQNDTSDENEKNLSKSTSHDHLLQDNAYSSEYKRERGKRRKNQSKDISPEDGVLILPKKDDTVEPEKFYSNHSGMLVSPKNNNTIKPVMRCRYHSGFLQRQIWSCCNQYRHSKGCQQTEDHVPRNYKEGELQAFWKYYPTPQACSNSRHAVAIDCEMGINIQGESELIRITAIDYFTNEVLINKLVYPDVPMADFQTRYSGVSARQMEEAYRERLCFLGKKVAREAIWKYVGPKTILVGHSANNDLSALRWIHESVIDTMLIDYLKFIEENQAQIAEEKEEARDTNISTTEAANINNIYRDKSENIVPGKTTFSNSKQKTGRSRRFSLKTLTQERIGKKIQQGRVGHDSLEDAIATRDLAHWHVVVQGMRNLTLT